MGKTNKDERLVARRHLVKTWKKREKELGLSNNVYARCHNPELDKFHRDMDKLNQELMSGWKEDRQHSAAHRHAAKKTKKRCKRMTKHTQNRQAMKIALDTD